MLGDTYAHCSLYSSDFGVAHGGRSFDAKLPAELVNVKKPHLCGCGPWVWFVPDLQFEKVGGYGYDDGKGMMMVRAHMCQHLGREV